MNAERVTFQIDELVLHGFAPADRYRIADTVERELGLLVADRGLPAEVTLGERAAVGSVDGGSFPIPAGAGPERIGAEIAEAIYGGLDRGGDE